MRGKVLFFPQETLTNIIPTPADFKATTLHSHIAGKYEITNFSGSFADGLAFCAMVHRVFPSKIPWSELSVKTRERNFTLAFKVFAMWWDIVDLSWCY